MTLNLGRWERENRQYKLVHVLLSSNSLESIRIIWLVYLQNQKCSLLLSILKMRKDLIVLTTSAYCHTSKHMFDVCGWLAEMKNKNEQFQL